MKTENLVLRKFALFLIFIFMFNGCSNEQSIEFIHDKWIDAKEQWNWEIRQKMAQDLIDHQKLIGKNKNEIIEMLGQPEEFSNLLELYYTIELYYGSNIDPVRIEYLIVTLDLDQKVIRYSRKIEIDKT